MNQTQKRLTIINLAISITDIETIQLQISKLDLLKSDQRIQEIIAVLNHESYAKAQRLIEAYIKTPTETIVQRNSIHNEVNHVEKDQAIIKKFELFEEESKEEDIKLPEMDYNALNDFAPQPQKRVKETADYDILLSVESPDNSLKKKKTIPIIVKKSSPSTFFDTPKQRKKDTMQKHVEENTSADIRYKAISYIEQKFQNMYKQYPPKMKADENFSSVNTWLMQIAYDGYTEADIEEMIKRIEKLSQSNQSEAAQLLLVTASTESQYARFRLARALYKGDILQGNLVEAFKLINSLALNDNYPEAICDLAQFYEKGIETEKNKKKAKTLYKEAMNLGIHRATKHYTRVSQENKKFFSFFRK